MTLQETIVVVFAVIVGVVGTARINRVITEDDWPPAVKFRQFWHRVTNDGPWSKLSDCPWCISPYVTAVNLAAALLSDLHPAWWIVNGWLAASYAASWIQYHDED